jgi:hypothetical protein
VIGNLPSFEQVDQKLTGYAKKGCGLDCGKFGLVLNDQDGLAFIQESEQVNQKRIERLGQEAGFPRRADQFRVGFSQSFVQLIDFAVSGIAYGSPPLLSHMLKGTALSGRFLGHVSSSFNIRYKRYIC